MIELLLALLTLCTVLIALLGLSETELTAVVVAVILGFAVHGAWNQLDSLESKVATSQSILIDAQAAKRAAQQELEEASNTIMSLTQELKEAKVENLKLPLCIQEVELGNATFEEIQEILEK